MKTEARSVRLLVVALTLGILPAAVAAEVHQATGFKVVNVTSTTADIWTRITLRAAANPADAPLPRIEAFEAKTGKPVALRENRAFPDTRVVVHMPDGMDLGAAAGGAPAATGQTRVRFRPKGTAAWSETPWQQAGLEQDGIAVHSLSGVIPGTRYEVVVQARRNADDSRPDDQPGEFTSAPLPDQRQPVTFCVMTCQKYERLDHPDGLAIYPAMGALRPDFFVNTGDVVYYDQGPVIALTPALARFHWARMFALPTLRDFHRNHTSFFMKDDHDILANDCGPATRSGELTYAGGVRLFREQTASPAKANRTFRWGRDLQVWLMEGRDYRTPDWTEKRTPPPTLWGREQIKWLGETLAASTATFRVILTTVPVVGPDRSNKDDNYANAGFAVEGKEIRELLARHPNLTVITGDRHWQYVSVDPATSVNEWSVGPSTAAHAGGWEEKTPRPEHRFLRTGQGGFFSGVVTPTATGASLELRLHDVDGRVVYREQR
jgi:alkaline phosphatase D